MTPVSDGKRKKGPRPPTWAGATLRGAIGTPSARLSLVGLRPRRARLRFTWQAESNEHAHKEQEQGRGAGHGSLLRQVYP